MPVSPARPDGARRTTSPPAAAAGCARTAAARGADKGAALQPGETAQHQGPLAHEQAPAPCGGESQAGLASPASPRDALDIGRSRRCNATTASAAPASRRAIRSSRCPSSKGARVRARSSSGRRPESSKERSAVRGAAARARPFVAGWSWTRSGSTRPSTARPSRAAIPAGIRAGGATGRRARVSSSSAASGSTGSSGCSDLASSSPWAGSRSSVYWGSPASQSASAPGSRSATPSRSRFRTPQVRAAGSTR